MSATIESLVHTLLDKALSYLHTDADGGLLYVDPNDGRQISAHYGLSHLMAALMLLGDPRGEVLLAQMIASIKQHQALPGYHADFNNFAIALVLDRISDRELKLRAEDALLQAPDSNHNTVNWLPMRMYVNLTRFRINGNENYRRVADKCREQILRAINTDGSIEDRMPHGISFNLQYDISSLALLVFLNEHGCDFPTARPMGFLMQCIAPDGDINYQGRGTNQIFAWGPWIYLLAASGNKQLLDKSLDFFAPRIKATLDNNSMLLNEHSGEHRHLWWDYHYASVYIAHCLLWLVMASKVQPCVQPELAPLGDSGMHIFSTADAFVAVFDGRKEYLAEHGPAVCAVFAHGKPLVKGTFGPWRGLFGNTHAMESVVIRNYCGLFAVRRSTPGIIHKIRERLHIPAPQDVQYAVKPLFVPVKVDISPSHIKITWTADAKRECFFNIPVLSSHTSLRLTADGRPMPLRSFQTIDTQYGTARLFQSQAARVARWELVINL